MNLKNEKILIQIELLIKKKKMILYYIKNIVLKL